ncbi:MAG: glycosyltransferase family 39 protein [Planctomycetes bacterium]|nr:glycosyltransferase family 39 protein [Planctomycetota bacterium]
MIIPDSEPDRRRLSPAAWILLAAACLPFFAALGRMQLWGGEGRWLCVAREMLKSGDWLEPRINGQTWAFKPLLSYWIIAALGALCGGVSEFLARLPSAACALASVFLTAWMAARLFGRSAGPLAGAALATSVSFVTWGRTASSDMMNVAFITAATAVYVASLDRFRPWQAFAFLALLGLGGQAKGLPAVVLPSAIAAADAVFHRRSELLRNSAWFAAALPLGAFCYGFPFLLSRLHTGDWALVRYMWWENVVRIYDPYDHHDNPWPYYFGIVPAMLAPWSLWLPGAFGWAAKTLREHRGFRFAALAFTLVFAAFTVSASRRSYYILPILPFAAMLVGGFWEAVLARVERGERLEAVWKWLFAGPIVIFVTVLTLAAAALAAGRFLHGTPGAVARLLPGALTVAAALLAAAVATAALLRRRPRAALHTLLTTAAACALYSAIAGDSLRDSHLVERRFAAQVRAVHVGPLLYYRADDSKLYYYAGNGWLFHKPEEIRDCAKGGGAGPGLEAWVLTEPRYLGELATSPVLEIEEVLRSGGEELPYERKREIYVLVKCRAR